MEQEQSTNSTEQRRKLLKGALGVSSVMAMGYSGSALASIQCVEKIRTNGGYPIGPRQFTRVDPRSTVDSPGWAWIAVEIYLYKPRNNSGTCSASSSNAVEAFDLNGTLYQINVDGTLTQRGLTSAYCRYTSGNGTTYPQSGWVLAYFNDGGNLTTSYPLQTSAAEGATPATASCLTSVNAGVVSNFIFGG